MNRMIMDLIMKFAALGDSIIKGVLFNQEENGLGHYSLSDRNIVDRVAERLHSEVLNLGKMGCTIEVGERILERHLTRLDGAQYVLMCYGGNDSDYDWKAIADHPEGEHYPKTPLRVFEKTYMRVVNKVRELGYTPLIMSLPPMDAQQYFNFFTSTLLLCAAPTFTAFRNACIDGSILYSSGCSSGSISKTRIFGLLIALSSQTLLLIC